MRSAQYLKSLPIWYTQIMITTVVMITQIRREVNRWLRERSTSRRRLVDSSPRRPYAGRRIRPTCRRSRRVRSGAGEAGARQMGSPRSKGLDGLVAKLVTSLSVSAPMILESDRPCLWSHVPNEKRARSVAATLLQQSSAPIQEATRFCGAGGGGV